MNVAISFDITSLFAAPCVSVSNDNVMSGMSWHLVVNTVKSTVRTDFF